MQLKKILAPLDGSEMAARALEHAVALARLCQSEIGLLHVVDLNRHISAFEQVSTGGYVPAEVKESGYALLAQAMRGVPQDVPAQAIVRVGAPAETILDVCREGGYDMIVMGNRGLGTIKQLLLGSVSQYVLHGAPCPVTIVR